MESIQQYKEIQNIMFDNRLWIFIRENMFTKKKQALYKPSRLKDSDGQKASICINKITNHAIIPIREGFDPRDNFHGSSGTALR